MIRLTPSPSSCALLPFVAVAWLKRRLCHVLPLPVAAETPPLPCGFHSALYCASTAFAAKTLPFRPVIRYQMSVREATNHVDTLLGNMVQ